MKKLNESHAKRERYQQNFERLKNQHEIEKKSFDEHKKIIDDAEETLEKMRRERNTYGKEIKLKEEQEFSKKEEINDVLNKKKKLQNQVRGY